MYENISCDFIFITYCIAALHKFSEVSQWYYLSVKYMFFSYFI